MCRTFPSALTVPAVVCGYPNAPPAGPAMPRAVATPAPGRLYVPWGMLAAIDLHGCAGRLANRDSIRARVTVAVLRTDVWPRRAAHAAEGVCRSRATTSTRPSRSPQRWQRSPGRPCHNGVQWFYKAISPLLRSDFAQSTAGHTPNGDLTDSIVPSDGTAVPLSSGRTP